MANSSNKGRGSSNAKKSPARKPAAKKTAPKNEPVKAKQQHNQLAAIVLFSVSLLLLCLLFIPGEAVWGGLRSLMFGLFGLTAYLIPVVLIYIAVMATLNKLDLQVGYKVGEAALLIVLIASAIHIFRFIGEADYVDDIKNAYFEYIDTGSTVGSGAVGAMIGGLILLITGSSKGAAIAIIIVLLFLALMLVTGTTLIKLFRGLAKPVQKVGEYTENKINSRYADEEETQAEAPAPEKKKIKKQIDFALPEEEKVDVIPLEEKVEPNTNVQLDDIISKINGGPASQKKAEPEKKEEKPAEIEGKDVNLKGDDPEITKLVYKLPPLDCLSLPDRSGSTNYEDELKQNATKLVDTLKSFGVETRVVDICRGPSVTRYELQPAAGVKISRITNLSDDIALNLASSGVRIAPIPNKSAVGVEVPNKSRSTVTLRELIDTDSYRKNVEKSKLSVALGKDIAGNGTYADIEKMPHLLVAGTTGSGKSVCMNTMIVSILYNARPDEVKLLMIDPKQVEFTVYNGIPHLLVPVVSDPRKASGALAWAVSEMLQRYKMFSDNNVRDIKGYNYACEENGKEKLPHIVIFIDELSDLMMAAPHEVEDSICRLAQMARAAGMHLVIATQRPSVDVITGLIKANIPSRLSLKTSSQIDSRTIIDSVGAEKLLGNGDMLFYPVGIEKPMRIQGCFLSEKEVEKVVDFIKNQGNTDYDENVIAEIERQAAMDKKKGGAADSDGDGADGDTDEMLPKAIEVVVENQKASTTLLQNKLKLGYARAARIMDELETRGIIGPFEGSKPRKVLISKQQWYEMNALASGGSSNVNPITVEGNETAEPGVIFTEDE